MFWLLFWSGQMLISLSQAKKRPEICLILLFMIMIHKEAIYIIKWDLLNISWYLVTHLKLIHNVLSSHNHRQYYETTKQIKFRGAFSGDFNSNTVYIKALMMWALKRALSISFDTRELFYERAFVIMCKQ